jgi:hypothetical protein
MNAEVQSKIHKFLYNLSTENYNGANIELKDILKRKVNDRFQAALEQVKQADPKNKSQDI